MQFKTKKDELAALVIVDFLYEDVKKHLKKKFEELGFLVTEEGKGFNLIFDLELKNSGFSAKFVFHNLWLEIVTRDRDVKLLEFDVELFNGNWMLEKAGEVMLSKLEIFKTFVKHKDKSSEEINKEVKKLSHLYNRLNVKTIKKKDGEQNVSS